MRPRLNVLALAFCTFFVLSCLALVACGGSNSGGSGGGGATPTITSVSVSCVAQSVSVQQTNQCTANVQGTGGYSKAVNWAVNGASGGNSTVGTITASGLYTAPAGVPSPAAVTIAATSVEDSTKNGSAPVSVKLLIGVSPNTASVQVFHNQQFTATVSGVSSTGVIWSVNGTSGGNLTVGQIDSTGFYLAPNAVPSSSTITITATSQADTTQSASSALTILPGTNPPVILSATPAADQAGVALDSAIEIQFSDTLDPSTVNSSTFTLSSGSKTLPSSVSYDPAKNIVTIAPGGVFAPGAQYIVTVSNLVANPAGTPLAASSQWLFTTQPVSAANGVVSAPTGTVPATLTVVSYGGQESTPDSSGNFAASLTPMGTNLVAAMVPGKSFGWLAIAGDQSQGSNAAAAQRLVRALAAQTLVPGRPSVHVTRYQVTASPHAASAPASVAVDSQTTAESLLFISPYLYHSNLDRSSAIRAAIAADPNTALLATALEAASNDSDPLANAAVRTALITAIKSVLATLSSSASLQPASQIAHPQIKLTSEYARPASTSTANTSLLATPNQCGSTSGSGNLPCLDLDYISTTASVDSNAQNQYKITVDNQSCGVQHPGLAGWGCSADWIILVAPITHPPSSGVFSILP